MQVLASLEDVWLLLKVLLDDSKLQQFTFLLSWDRMNEKEKMRLYNKYNCSEVNVFFYSSRGLTKNARKSISFHFLPFLPGHLDDHDAKHAETHGCLFGKFLHF